MKELDENMKTILKNVTNLQKTIKILESDMLIHFYDGVGVCSYSKTAIIKLLGERWK